MIKLAYQSIVPANMREVIYRKRKGIKPPSFTYAQDRLFTYHNCDFMQDEKFARAYAAGEATDSWGSSKIHWRAHIACWAATIGKDLEGDFVECGVNRGGLAKTIVEFTEFKNLDKKFYLLDTYEGLKDELLSEGERNRYNQYEGYYTPCYDAVVKTFADTPNCVIVKGMVPDTLSQVKSQKVAFISIDMNCAAPEIAAAEYFWPKMSKGAIMLLDDYGWRSHYEQKVAFDKFCQQRNVMPLSLPTGQGVIVKM